MSTSVVEFKLNGVNWADVSADVLPGIAVSYGISGGGPNDRCAGTGTMRLVMNNMASNSGGLQGYYSPGHVNCRVGFDVNTQARWRVPAETTGAFAGHAFEPTAFAIGLVARTWMIGVIQSISPLPGRYASQQTMVECVDWIDIAAQVNTSADLQVNKRTDQILSEVLAAMDTQPVSMALATANSTFTYALDNVSDQSTKVLSVMADLARSEGGFCYVRGDGTLVLESRLGRAATEPAYAFNDTMHGLEVSRARTDLFNRFFVTVHPRRVDAAATTVLYSLDTKPQIDPGQTITMLGPYGDPLNGNKRCGGTDMVTPVATTDYTMNSLATGAGTDLTTFLTATASMTGNVVHWTLTNTGATTGFITKLQVRGRGLYDFQPLTVTAEDAASISAYGEQPCTVDMPYQDDVYVGSGFAEFLVNLYKTPTSRAKKITFILLGNSTLTEAALACDIGTRVSLVETQTGIDVDFFIHAIEVTYTSFYTVSWLLAPADMASYWQLGTSNAGELGLTTRLGFA